MADSGYDFSDDRAIASEFGTMGDMDRLIGEARVHGIEIVMDRVVTHSSSEHSWFQAAPDGGPPSALQASFGGSAWTWVPEIEQYY